MTSNRYKKNKKQVWFYLGNKCARCGSTHNLQLDHIDPTTKKFEVSQKLGGKLGLLWEEINKCQLLCQPCHKEKTKEDQKIIQIKRKDFMYRNERFDPILQQDMVDITIDGTKKDGAAYIKYIEFVAERKGISVEDVIKEEDEFFTKYLNFKCWKDWIVNPKAWDENEKLLSKEYTKEEIKEWKENLNRKYLKIKEEQPHLYEKFESFYIDKAGEYKDDDEEEKKIPYPKVVDFLIDLERNEVYFPENYGDSND